MVIQRSTIITVCTGILFLGLSILLYAHFGYPRVSRVFFFPSDRTLVISGEARKIPRKESLEENIGAYVKEWLLGPLKLEHRPLFPWGTKLSAVLVRDGRLYLDFTSPIILQNLEKSLSPREIIDVVNRGLTFNFPRIKEIFVSVDGEPLLFKADTERVS